MTGRSPQPCIPCVLGGAAVAALAAAGVWHLIGRMRR